MEILKSWTLLSSPLFLSPTFIVVMYVHFSLILGLSMYKKVLVPSLKISDNCDGPDQVDKCIGRMNDKVGILASSLT